jgi:hypothetical protein
MRDGATGFLNLGQGQLNGQHGANHGVVVTFSDGALAHEGVL